MPSFVVVTDPSEYDHELIRSDASTMERGQFTDANIRKVFGKTKKNKKQR